MKLLRAFLLTLAIVGSAQAGEMPYGINSPTPIDQILVFLSLWF